MPRRTLIVICLVAIVSYACYRTAYHNRYARYFAEIMEAIDENYVEPIDDEQLFESSIKGMVGQLDPFSQYIDRRHARQFQQMILDGRFDGVGIEVTIDPQSKQLRVATPIVGTPAYEAGIAAGDLITKINDRDTAGVRLAELSDSLHGKPGSPVTLEVLREGKPPRKIRLVRREIKVDAVLGDTRNSDDTWNFLLPGHDRIGYVRIKQFDDHTLEELDAALRQLGGPPAEGENATSAMRGLILDMRGNPGGLLDVAAEVAGLFLNEGDLLVTTRGRDGRELERWEVEEPGAYRHLPLVVLVDHDSASASEIVAAALSDHQRAAIVGERTYGKGTVQNVIPVAGGRSMLKLTIATYWRPNGQNIHRLDRQDQSGEWGVRPDAGDEVELSKKEYDEWRHQRRQRDIVGAKGAAASQPPAPLVDRQLDRAVEILERRIERG